MLPTEKATLHLSNNLLITSNVLTNKNDLYKSIPQHLYIISDEQPKDGDWCYDKHNNCLVSPKDLEKTNSLDIKDYFMKIVATTDKSLGITDHKISPVPNFVDMPQLPESFIKDYIKDYNEGKPITVVYLEMEEKLHIGETIDDSYPKEFVESLNKIKTRPDNTVFIHAPKMYSRNELESFIELAWATCSATKYKEGDDIGADCKDWMNTNLK